MTAEGAFMFFWRTGLAEAYLLYCHLRDEEQSRAEAALAPPAKEKKEI